MDTVSDTSLSVEDCHCPVCLDFFMEPVTLPCSHTFCKTCFLESVDKTTLCCPMCRKRVSTWVRHNNRNKSLVNQKLWVQIQTRFPLETQRRLSGQEGEEAAAVSVCFPKVSEPGELRQEYEDQVFKLTEEKRAMDEEETKASEEYIQKLLAEEQELLQQEMRRREEDEQLARLLSNQLNSAPPWQESSRPADVAPAKKKEADSGQIRRFVCPLLFKANSPNSDKENVVVSEVPPTSQPTSLHPEDRLIADAHSSSCKRKTPALTEEMAATKRSCPSSAAKLGGSAVCHAELLSRQRQEEEDQRLALLLQKELDEEERQRCPDRRKGSTDAYLLRQNHRSKVEGKNPGNASRRISRKPSASSSSKQTTLTELFSNLRS